jgi:hypothetical protein
MRHLPTVAALGFLLAAGCTAHNPNFVGDAGGGGGGGSTDLAGVTLDLAGVVLDLSGPMGSCMGDQRKCSGTAASDRCEGGMFVIDRECPANSTCSANYCAQPTAVFGTSIGARCDAQGGAQQIQCLAQPNLSCQPFVDTATKSLRWFCDSVVGSGRAGTHCTKGSECRSGVCAAAGVCFDACQRDQDCFAPAANPQLTCKSLEITVEGVTVTQKGCG